MKRRIFAAALACALSLSLLASCGSSSGSASGSVSSSQDGSASTSSPDQSVDASASSSDISAPDASAPDTSQPDGSTSEQPEAPAKSTLTLSKTDFTLKSAGAKWKLKYTCKPAVEGAVAEFTSSDESIATVAKDGTVTAVAPGHATITLKYGDLTAQCIVRCRWEENTDPVKLEKPSEPEKPAAKKVDLAEFYKTLSGSYQLGNLSLADKATLDAAYPGLTDVSTEQLNAYITMMSMNASEIVLVQVKDSKDIDAVKTAMQTRIDNQVNGGAWYPESTRIWTECSKIVTNGNYVMMIVNEDYESIVKDFNALF